MSKPDNFCFVPGYDRFLRRSSEMIVTAMHMKARANKMFFAPDVFNRNASWSKLIPLVNSLARMLFSAISSIKLKIEYRISEMAAIIG